MSKKRNEIEIDSDSDIQTDCDEKTKLKSCDQKKVI